MLVDSVLCVTGLGCMGNGLSNIYNREYKSGVKKLAEGTLRMALCTAAVVIAAEIFMQRNMPVSARQNMSARPDALVRDFCRNLKVDEGKFSEGTCIAKMLKMPDEILGKIRYTSSDTVIRYCKDVYTNDRNPILDKVNLDECINHLFDASQSGKTLERIL